MTLSKMSKISVMSADDFNCLLEHFLYSLELNVCWCVSLWVFRMPLCLEGYTVKHLHAKNAKPLLQLGGFSFAFLSIHTF